MASTSLTPCRFYAQGNCRYGNSCRFYHEPKAGGFFGNRTLAPPTFQPQGGAAVNPSAKPNQNLDVLVEAVKKDMVEWINSKIWPYSCYGPVGLKPCLPGFEDLSAEEFRLAYMQHGNNIPPEIPLKFQQVQQLRVNYQQPTVENRAIIERVATTNVPVAGATPVSPFGGQPAAAPVQGSIFGGGVSQSQPTASIFGGASTAVQQQAPGSIFGGSGNTFGGTSTFGQQSAATFFQTPPVQQTPPTSSGLFGAQTNQPQTLFGQPAQVAPQQQTGLFQQQATSSIFQQANKPQGGIFQQQPQMTPTSAAPQLQGNLFSGQQPQQPPTGLFQQPQQAQPAGSIFGGGGGQQQQGSLFAHPGGSIFGGNTAQTAPASTGNIFGGAVAQQPLPQQAPSASIFGGGTGGFGGGTGSQPQQPPSTGPAVAQKFVYSLESELSPEELEAFKASEFTIDSLPTKLPPQSLCL